MDYIYFIKLNLNVINQNQESATGKVEIEVNNKVYAIERTSEKYVKRLKGEETLEAKTDLDFYANDRVMDENISHNGLTRNDTDKYIKEKEQQLDKLIGAKPSMSDAMTPPPRRSPVGAVSQAERLTT